MKRITKAEAIKSLQPDAQFVITGGVINWLSPDIEQPTQAKIEAEIARLTEQLPAKMAEESRRIAYREEADPLFFKVQRGEATQEEWLEKVQEIKDRYPY